MILCLDAGNTQIFGGLFRDGKVILRFRTGSERRASSDEIGVFLKNVIKENGHNPKEIRRIAFCSVIPDLNHSLINSCKHYFNLEPFNLRPGVKTGLKIKYSNQSEVGADRIANAIGGISHFPRKNLIIADFGTATTFDVITGNMEYLGGAILPGFRIAMEALEQRTAKLPRVEIIAPKQVCGRSTIESIQSGLFYSNLGAIKEITKRIADETFQGKKPVIIGTGGFCGLFREANVFDEILPDLVLDGIFKAQEMNQ